MNRTSSVALKAMVSRVTPAQVVCVGMAMSPPAPVLSRILRKHFSDGVRACSPAEAVASADLGVLWTVGAEFEVALDHAFSAVRGPHAGQSIYLYVPWRPPPDVSERVDAPVKSIFMPPALVRALGPRYAACQLAELVFHATVTGLWNMAPRCTAEVHVIGRRGAAGDRATKTSAEPSAVPQHAIAIPHRGDGADLAACLDHVAAAKSDTGRVLVGIDEDWGAPMSALAAEHEAVRFYRNPSPPGGPYRVVRGLLEHDDAEFFVFQDSDDVPTRDRFRRLLGHMQDRGLDLAGSHELRVDATALRVFPVRYPLDVNAALDLDAGFPLLHPTSAVRAAKYRQVGGFGTTRRYGHDTQFLLRAHFDLRIGNADAFLYVRKTASTSLSGATETGLRSPVRRAILRRLNRHFLEVKSGGLDIEASLLAPRHREDEDDLIPMPPHEPVSSW